MFADTSLSRLACRNWALSMKRSCPREKDMYFSVLLGMQETRPSTLEMACISKWLSYPRRLWNTTGMVVVLGLSRSLRLQALWAAPRYLPVMWQWSFTESLSRGLSHTRHLLAVLWLSQSALVIVMACGFSSTFWIPRSSTWRARRKCSNALVPRYSAGASVFPSHRTTT